MSLAPGARATMLAPLAATVLASLAATIRTSLAATIRASLAATTLLAVTAHAAAPGGSAELTALARSSVDSRFVPDPRDPARDLVTGDTRIELEQRALEHYTTLQASNPAQFSRLSRRVLGHRSASELHAFALAELSAGRPASAEQAWRRLVEEHPEAPEAGPALVKLAASRHRAGERAGAAEDLARVPELNLEAAADAEPLMARLLAEAEAELASRQPRPTGRDRVVLHRSLASRDLDRARELSEWTAGWDLLDEVARTLRLQTSGDLLRKLKKLGQDDIRLDTITQLVPLEDRQDGVRIEELLRDPTALKAAEARAKSRSEGKQLERFDGLSKIMQAQVWLVARCIEALELEPQALALGQRSLAERHALARHVEQLMSADARALAPEDAGVARLAHLADANGNRKHDMLRDDVGILRPNRPAVEGDLRNAQEKRIDDDNKRRIADLFEAMGTTEKALFHSLVTACEETLPGQPPRVVPERVDLLLARLAERSAPVWAAAKKPGRAEREGDAERDYLARLNVLRMPGETLDEIIRREVLEQERPDAGPASIAGDARTAELVAELASLGRRWQGAWLFEDDPQPASGERGRTASEKFARAQVIRGQLDDVAAAHALDAIVVSLATDLESQGMRLGAGGMAALRQRVEHEDLGSLAISFDELGNFSGIKNLLAFTEPGSGLGELGPGRLAYGFGLDLTSGAPGGSLGWRTTKEIRDGRASLRYHVGATGLPAGPTDVAGASVRFRQREVWQPEVGGDMSFLRGLAGRGFLNLIRDVTLKHQRALDATCAEHEEARSKGRGPFIRSMTQSGAEARPATLFTESLGYSEQDFGSDEEAFLALHDSYEYEKGRQKSLLNRSSGKVRFAGFGLLAAFFAGDIYLLAGPKFAFKDFRLFSTFLEGPERRLQSEEAELRRIAVPESFGRGKGERHFTRVALHQGPDAEGRSRFAPDGEPDVRVARFDLPPAAGTRVASLAGVAGAEPAEGIANDPGLLLPPEELEALLGLNRWLFARGVPLEIRATKDEGVYALVPMGLASWASHSIDFHVAANDAALGLAISADGHPLLLAPGRLHGVVVDWLRETRAITRAGESDQRHRACFSLAPGTPAARVIEESAFLLRTEVVHGRVLGTVRIATRFREPSRELRVQANVLSPRDEDSGMRLAAIVDEARRFGGRPLPEPPPVALARALPHSDGSLADPVALAPGFLEALRGMREDDVTAFKQRNIRLAVLRSSGEGDGAFDQDNVRLIQSLSLSHHGRMLSGRALEHAHWVLTHEGLFQADGGSLAQQVNYLESRGVEPFLPGREMEGAADPLTRLLMERAGIDEAAALATLHARMSDETRRALQRGELPRENVSAGTRIVTSSRSGTARGVQWTVSDGTAEAHLLPPLSLSTNEGRYVTALALGADLPALALAVADQVPHAVSNSTHEQLEDDLAEAVGEGLAAPDSDLSFSARLHGATLDFRLAQAPLAGALARCKNATLFPPAYGVDLRKQAEAIVAGGPMTLVGIAEAGMRFAGRSWVGWRRLSTMLGGPFAGDDDRPRSGGGDDGGGDDGGGGDPGGGGPPRPGGDPPGRGGDRPQPGDGGGVRPDDPGTDPPGDPRGGGGTPGRGGDRPDPPGTGGDRDPPGDVAGDPRPGDDPPGRGGGRPDPPDPSDRPRRPVD